MAYAITQTCCNDASCVSVCPVNCIHPAPGEPDFGHTDMLYIDPHTCIDCGACADACPVDAVLPVDALSEPMEQYAEINAAYYAERQSEAAERDPAPNFHHWESPVFDHAVPSDFEPLDVAVIGTGPAGMYAVEDLLLHTNSRVTLIDRLATPGGLIRYGVAPDHPSTKKVGNTFARFHDHPRLRLDLGTEISRDITADELAARHDAAIYAVGASSARSLDIPGEDLPGSLAATTVVAWYNGHPDVPADIIDLSAERVVIVGNGNVALDVARILTSEPDTLTDSSIPAEVLARLRASNIREVVLLGRRGPEDAAYTAPELRALADHKHRGLVIDTHDERIAESIDAGVQGDKAQLVSELERDRIDWSAPPPDGRRIVLRFHSAPREFLGEAEVRGLSVTGGSGDTDIRAGTVVRAIGYRATPVPGLPFDESTGTIPHTAGRVDNRPGTYVVGWIKRGPSGGIGTNRACARETVGTLLDDAVAGRIATAHRPGAAHPAPRKGSLLRRLVTAATVPRRDRHRSTPR